MTPQLIIQWAGAALASASAAILVAAAIAFIYVLFSKARS